MASSTNQTPDLAVFKTKPIGADGNFTLGWQQTFQDLVSAKVNSPKAYSITHAQRLALHTANVTTGSMVFETDTSHVFVWSGKAWVQLV